MLCCFLPRPVAPIVGNTSPVKYRQSFVDGQPYEPTAESALAIKCRYVARGREQTILYSNIGSVGIAKHALCDKMQQAAISRCPNVRRPAVVRQDSRDRNSFVRVQLQVQCGPHFHSYLLSSVFYAISSFCRSAAPGNRTRDTRFYSLALRSL